ncbi:unnamed protein product, partial [Musa textilis]
MPPPSLVVPRPGLAAQWWYHHPTRRCHRSGSRVLGGATAQPWLLATSRCHCPSLGDATT